jgi:hypothetical protein
LRFIQVALKEFYFLSGILILYIMCIAVAQLVVALRYKPEGRGFDHRLCHGNFSLKQSFWPHCGPGVDSTSNRSEYQEYFLGVKAAGAYS